MHLLPNGEVACLGNGQDLIFFNPETQAWREIGEAGVIPHGEDDLPGIEAERIECDERSQPERRHVPQTLDCGLHPARDDRPRGGGDEPGEKRTHAGAPAAPRFIRPREMSIL